MEVNTLYEKRRVTAGKGRDLNATAGGKCGDTVLFNRRTFAHCLICPADNMWNYSNFLVHAVVIAK